MKILYTLTESWFFVSHFYDRAIEAQKNGFQVYVLARNSGGVEAIKEAGFVFIESKIERGWVGFKCFSQSVLEYRSVFKIIKPDIVHNVALKCIVVSALGSLGFTRMSAIHAPVGLGYIFSSEDFKARVLRVVFTIAIKSVLKIGRSVVIVENDDDFQYIVKSKWVAVGRVYLIEGAGVDLKRFGFKPLPRGKRYVVLISRMLRDKGVYEFVEAARKLKEVWPDVGFKLVGAPDQGNPSSIDKDILIKWNSENIVEWLGFKNNICELLEEAWLVCLPSYREGLPKSVIEAMAVVRPVVACDVPGCRALIENNQNGILVPARDSDSLARAIDELLRDPLKAEKYGRASRLIAEQRLSIETINRNTLAIYIKILDEFKGSSPFPVGRGAGADGG